MASSSQPTASGESVPEEALQFEVEKRRSRETRWRKFARHRMALLGLGVLVLFATMAVFAPIVAWQDHLHIDLYRVHEPPSLDHILGTDAGGRDVFARIIFAARISLTVGTIAALIASVVGLLIGMTSGYLGGRWDDVLMRFTEMVMTFPTLFAVILLVSLLGPNLLNVIMVIGFLGWEGKARLVRGIVLSIREMDFVTAARAVGASDRRLIFVHIMPSILGYVMVAATITVAGAILTEATLSFLGLGVQIPTPTWGNMMNAAQSLHTLQHRWWIWVPPGVAISATVVAVNFVGDGLRDALDPRTVVD